MSDDSGLIEGRDFYYDDDGRMVFTVLYLRERGTCCGSGCRHCPYRPEGEGAPAEAPRLASN